MPGYTVRAVAERLGIPTATFRSWTQRYDIGPRTHRPGQHRLYSEADIAALEQMVALIHRGVSPASAARFMRQAIPAGRSVRGIIGTDVLDAVIECRRAGRLRRPGRADRQYARTPRSGSHLESTVPPGLSDHRATPTRPRWLYQYRTRSVLGGLGQSGQNRPPRQRGGHIDPHRAGLQSGRAPFPPTTSTSSRPDRTVRRGPHDRRRRTHPSRARRTGAHPRGRRCGLVPDGRDRRSRGSRNFRHGTDFRRRPGLDTHRPATRNSPARRSRRRARPTTTTRLPRRTPRAPIRSRTSPRCRHATTIGSPLDECGQAAPRHPARRCAHRSQRRVPAGRSGTSTAAHSAKPGCRRTPARPRPMPIVKL